jgi:hypothetical protein
MTVVSSCDGVMGAEERCGAKSGYDFAKKYLQREEIFKNARVIQTVPTRKSSISREVQEPRGDTSRAGT